MKAFGLGDLAIKIHSDSSAARGHAQRQGQNLENTFAFELTPSDLDEIDALDGSLDGGHRANKEPEEIIHLTLHYDPDAKAQERNNAHGIDDTVLHVFWVSPHEEETEVPTSS